MVFPAKKNQIYTYIQTYTMVIALSALCIEQAHAACLKNHVVCVNWMYFSGG